MKFLKKYYLFLLLFLIVLTVLIFKPNTVLNQQNNEDVYPAEILAITDTNERRFEKIDYISQVILARIEKTGEQTKLSTNYIVKNSPVIYETGDKILLGKSAAERDSNSYYVIGYDRTGIVFALTIAFLLLVLVVAKKQGLKSILAMAYTFFILIFLLLPLLIDKQSPILVGLIGIVLVIPITFLFTHGQNKKTFSALIATIITLIFSGLLSYFILTLAKITGPSQEEIDILIYSSKGMYDLTGILIAGVIIGLLGILDDVTVSQASLVAELHKMSPKLNRKNLFKKSMIVGKDHIASVVNTMILVYAGASLSGLILLATYPRPLIVLLNDEAVLVPIIVALIGSIGLILAVPITSLITIRILKKSS